MKIPISDRLLACAAFVAPGERVADVGCDHGYLSIYLLTQGIASHCIASDINLQPLQSAMRNAEKYSVRDQMEFYLSNGVQSIPRNFDTLICAGMGADTMISILEAATWLQDRNYRMILQCQSKTPLLRKYLSDHGWQITEEAVLKDGRFLYTVMDVSWQPEHSHLTEAECYFPPALLENPSRQVPAYYQWVVGCLRLSASHQPAQLPILQALEQLSQQASLRWLASDQTKTQEELL